MSSISYGFPPISSISARVLILGSLPGEVSIRRHEYYAQPRNIFWRIMGELFGIAPDLPYVARVAALIENHVAVWDVCAAAHRPGSLDSSIRTASVEANDFNPFFSEHPRVSLICFNGAKAGALYETRVLPKLGDNLRNLSRQVLPSTSPAHASVPYEAKISAWKVVCQPRGS
jgi:double-stranded uracil-DNA glycosylase